MLSESLEWLALQLTFLNELEDLGFLRQLKRTWQALQTNETFAPLIGDLLREADELEDAHYADQEKEVQDIVALKARVVALRPDSQDFRSQKFIDGALALRYLDSFGWFDELVSKPRNNSGERNPERAKNLLQLVTSALHRMRFTRGEGAEMRPTEEDQCPALEPLEHPRITIDQRLGLHHRAWVTERASNPCFAARELDHLVSQMTSGPQEPTFNPLFDRMGHSTQELATQAKAHLRHVEHELKLRCSRRRSNLAVLERFRGRCQWHDRSHLLGLANSEGGKPEDKLVAVMARWLYDNGFNPIAQASAGGLRPDLFDASRRPAVYIEAKQYRASPASVIRKALKQVDDTAAQFTADPYRIEEAFLAVFRLGGSLASPATTVIRRPAYTVYVVIIDLKDIKESGSREKSAPVRITVESLTAPDREPSRPRLLRKRRSRLKPPQR